MTVNFDPSADFVDCADVLEAVTLLRRGSGTGDSPRVIAHALRRAATTAEPTIRNRYHTRKNPPSDGRAVAVDVTWHLPVAELADPPRLGDVILDADQRRWTILAVQEATLRSRWQCAARDVAVVYGLDDTITILRAVFTKSCAGAAEADWLIFRTGVRARIQPATTDMVVAHAARQAARRCQVFLDEDLPLDHHHRIRGPDGTVYRIRWTIGRQRIGEPQTIDVEVVG